MGYGGLPLVANSTMTQVNQFNEDNGNYSAGEWVKVSSCLQFPPHFHWIHGRKKWSHDCRPCPKYQCTHQHLPKCTSTCFLEDLMNNLYVCGCICIDVPFQRLYMCADIVAGLAPQPLSYVHLWMVCQEELLWMFTIVSSHLAARLILHSTAMQGIAYLKFSSFSQYENSVTDSVIYTVRLPEWIQ